MSKNQPSTTQSRRITVESKEVATSTTQPIQDSQDTAIKKEQDNAKKEFSHYHKDVSDYETIDIYDVLDIYEVTNPAIQHAVKKLLVTGKRGHKDIVRDLKDAYSTISKAIVIEQRKANKKEAT